jgi:molybdopterin adenylyltransferase
MQKKQHSITPPLQHSSTAAIAVGIITISDRASGGEYDDLGGPALKDVAQKNNWHVLAEAIVPDDAERIQQTGRAAG